MGLKCVVHLQADTSQLTMGLEIRIFRQVVFGFLTVWLVAPHGLFRGHLYLDIYVELWEYFHSTKVLKYFFKDAENYFSKISLCK